MDCLPAVHAFCKISVPMDHGVISVPCAVRSSLIVKGDVRCLSFRISAFADREFVSIFADPLIVCVVS